MPDALADVWTVAWKEFKEFFAHGSGMRGGTLGVLLLMAVISIFLPLQAGKAWVQSPMLLMYWAWVPLLLVTVNITHGHGQLLLYSPPVAIGIVGLSLLGATLAASAGVLVSLRAATVKQAQQILSMAMMLVAIVPLLGLQALSKQWQGRLAQWIASAGLMRVVLTAMAVLAVLDALLLAAAMARFKRARLILD